MSRDILENISTLLAEGKLSELREQLCDLNVVDIAQAMESLPADELLRIFRILPKDISADVFSYLEPDSQAQLLNLITDSELESLLDDMFLDDTVDFLGVECLLDDVLDDGLIEDRQHLLGSALRAGQEAGAEARSGDDGLHE